MPDRYPILLFSSFVATFVLSKVLLSVTGKSKVAIKPELMATQAMKQGTPVLGGIAFCLGTLCISLFDPFLGEPGVAYPLIALLLFGLIGLLDDRMKLRSGNGDGLPSLFKLALQAQGALLLLILLGREALIDTRLEIGSFGIELSFAYYIFACFYILYFVNAVNITDGLDALAAGSSLPLLVLLLLLGNRSNGIASTALLGSLLAFLLFNRKPAKYFMGDCGSHALGAYIAISALLMRFEVVVFLASGLFLVELATSLIQIISIRRFGRKVFTIAPLHHAYELKGVAEGRIVTFFTLASWAFAFVSLLISR
ncbi:glycosyl transferase [Sphaerochaeta globosa]|uniref:Glycosyl transferase family 4 n=1 Tax=Sphaerochaeta globosa (strain ATCC BAA-1886 / DSM 22777 / Buddy) TaxID=158189 RepID=F0RYV2_SPHGB|nr:glycosyl transferase [Sphaerochaeta globosa]ADY13088.1 glycosyl transferase family 4 [Sphaerochaeta globosa str. Buddy]